MTVRIEVTQRDIDRAKAMQEKAFQAEEENSRISSFDSPCQCPIALATKRKVRKPVAVFGADHMEIAGYKEYRATKASEKKATKLIDNFDARNYDKCRPIIIEIEPEPVMDWYD